MEELDAKRQQLLECAKERFAEIFPCAGKSWSECFMQLGEELTFWYNDRTGNTHMEREAQ